MKSILWVYNVAKAIGCQLKIHQDPILYDHDDDEDKKVEND